MTPVDSMRMALLVLGNVRRAWRWVWLMHETEVIAWLPRLLAEVRR